MGIIGVNMNAVSRLEQFVDATSVITDINYLYKGQQPGAVRIGQKYENY